MRVGWDIVKLNDVCEIDWGNTKLTKSIFKAEGKYDVFSASGKMMGKTDFF